MVLLVSALLALRIELLQLLPGESDRDVTAAG